MSADCAWLPDHQLHVVETLGHANDLIAQLGDVLHRYLEPGPLEFESVVDNDIVLVTVIRIAPLPAAVASYAADALTQLRAAIEHALFAEVEHQLGRELDAAESRLVEMPARTTADAYEQWLSDRRWQALAPLQRNTPLAARIRDLQPYQRRDADNHPLRVLAEHTNRAKHRAPVVAATQLGVVIPDWQEPGVEVYAPAQDRPLEPGDVLASGPQHRRVPLSIWPKASIQRPHTGSWHVVMKELHAIEEWVRKIAIPHLLTGGHDVSTLPPRLDTTIGHEDVRVALAAAGVTSAADQASRHMQAEGVRPNLAEILGMHRASPAGPVIETWVRSLTDDEVLERFDRLAAIRNTGPEQADVVIRALLAEVTDSGR